MHSRFGRLACRRVEHPIRATKLNRVSSTSRLNRRPSPGTWPATRDRNAQFAHGGRPRQPQTEGPPRLVLPNENGTYLYLIMCLICRFMVRKKSAMKYMRRIGQNTGMLKLRACSEPQVSGHIPPPRITATHPPHIPGRTHTLKKVMQKAMTKAFVSEYQNLNSGSLRRQERRLSRKWGSGAWRRRRRGRWSMDSVLVRRLTCG